MSESPLKEKYAERFENLQKTHESELARLKEVAVPYLQRTAAQEHARNVIVISLEELARRRHAEVIDEQSRDLTYECRLFELYRQRLLDEEGTRADALDDARRDLDFFLKNSLAPSIKED